MSRSPSTVRANHSERQLLDALSRTPFVDSTELAGILGEPHATVHRILAKLLAEGIVGRVNHGTARLPSSQRYHLTAKGIGEAAWVLGFATPSDFVRAYPMSREWLTLLIRRMDAVASVYRLGASMSPGIDGLRSRVEFHRRGRFEATITLHDGRSFGVVRQGLALRRRSLYDRLRAIAEYDYSHAIFEPPIEKFAIQSYTAHLGRLERETPLTVAACSRASASCCDCLSGMTSPGMPGASGRGPGTLYITIYSALLVSIYALSHPSPGRLCPKRASCFRSPVPVPIVKTLGGTQRFRLYTNAGLNCTRWMGPALSLRR